MGESKGKIYNIVTSPLMNPEEGKVEQRRKSRAGGLPACREDGGEKGGGGRCIRGEKRRRMWFVVCCVCQKADPCRAVTSRKRRGNQGTLEMQHN